MLWIIVVHSVPDSFKMLFYIWRILSLRLHSFFSFLIGRNQPEVFRWPLLHQCQINTNFLDTRCRATFTNYKIVAPTKRSNAPFIYLSSFMINLNCSTVLFQAASEEYISFKRYTAFTVCISCINQQLKAALTTLRFTLPADRISNVLLAWDCWLNTLFTVSARYRWLFCFKLFDVANNNPDGDAFLELQH